MLPNETHDHPPTKATILSYSMTLTKALITYITEQDAWHEAPNHFLKSTYASDDSTGDFWSVA